MDVNSDYSGYSQNLVLANPQSSPSQVSNSSGVQQGNVTQSPVSFQQSQNSIPKVNTDIDISQEIFEEVEVIRKQISQQDVPEEIKTNVGRMINRLYRMAKFGSYSIEFEVVSKYVDVITSIPWNKYTKDVIDVKNAKAIMDQTHYGMDLVKNMILDYLAVMQMQRSKDLLDSQGKPTFRAPVFCFVGLQGVGKTSIAKSIAQALGREFVRIPMGALGSVKELRGVGKNSVDADPGLIIKALIKAKTLNPVMLLDEIDKTSGQEGLRSDMMSFLLEVLDPEQNSHFVDYYIDHPVDLSQVFFITTANTTGTISTALLDRLEVIRFTSYSDEEKIIIGKRYVLPAISKELGLSDTQIIFDEDVWPDIVRPLGFDAGIRQLERNIAKICRSVIREIFEQGVTQVRITKDNIRKYMPIGVAVLN
ncbi:MAG TPA: AAA family ATPase [Candidatus Dojkabacteria bacterium]|nr:AAA family ATPase [Candidatus Dojkabacteria bacterium]HQF36295.1 AAA family ATPase [Candidatus Dojkabacteria bacterium]